METRETTETPTETIETMALRRAVRFYYDAQKLRIQFGNRATKEVKTTELTEADKAFLEKAGTGLKSVEKDAVKEIERLLKGVDIWEGWLTEQRGIGPTVGGLLVSHVQCERYDTVSKMWRALGLAVIDGKAERRARGQKAAFNPWLKSKMIEVLGKGLIKVTPWSEEQGCFVTRSKDKETGLFVPATKEAAEWVRIYRGRKDRRRNQLIDPCMGCAGTGKVTYGEKGKTLKTATKKAQPCPNCDGKGGKAPWGKNDAHREIDARRVMVKLFLRDYYVQYRTMRGLEVRAPYAEEYLGRVHHG